MHRSFLLVAALYAGAAGAQAPQTSDPNIDIRRAATLADGMVRIAVHPLSNDLYTLAIYGDLVRFAAPYSAGVTVATAAQHGLGLNVLGLAFDPTGRVFLVGNDIASQVTTSRIRRGDPDGAGGFTWSTVAELAGIPRPINFEHDLNAIVVSPDGNYLYVNRGARTDHGEVQSVGGTAPGLRETALTSLLLRIPASATNLLLPNDVAALRAGGYYFADGLRNTFDLAFDAEGRLYGTENAGDRDDGDELNWIREGLHYGFPWRIGPHATPQQFPGYNPDDDPLVNPESVAYMEGYFHDDPTYPAPPAGVTFTDPVANLGPDADRFRVEATGELMDASNAGLAAYSLTPHRSPLGLTFATDSIPGQYGQAFMLSWTAGTVASDDLLTPFSDPGEDLLELRFIAPDTIEARRIVWGFSSPMDIVDDRMYVIELGGTRGLWELHFTGGIPNEPDPSSTARLEAAPNPFDERIRITVDVARTAAYRLEMTDVLGRRVALLHDGVLAVGRHSFTTRAGALTAGTYLVRLVGPEGSSTRTVVRR